MTTPNLAARAASPADTTAQGLSPAAAGTALIRLCAASFVAYCSYSMCRAPLLPLFARELGAGPSLVGFVMGASTLTGVFLKLPAGALSDLFGRRRLLMMGSLVFATLPFTYLAVSTLTLLVIVRFLHGSATAIFSPVASASLSDVAPAARRGAWLSTYSTAQGTGQAVGPILAGYLIAAGRFDLAFVVSGFIGLGVPFVVATWRGTPSSTAPVASFNELKRGVIEVASDRLVLITSSAHAAQFVLNGMLNAFLPLYGREVLNLSGSELGWLFGMQTVTTLMVRPAIGRLSDRVGRRAVIVSGLTVCSLAVFALSLATSFSTVLAVIATYAAGVAITTAATSAYITDITRRARYGAAHGVFGTIYDIGDALGPIAAGVLVAAVGYARMFQVMATVALVMALVFAVSTARHQQEPPRLPCPPFRDCENSLTGQTSDTLPPP
jgi:DHA1 family multidrug resistance protein-like MFS transporter